MSTKKNDTLLICDLNRGFTLNKTATLPTRPRQLLMFELPNKKKGIRREFVSKSCSTKSKQC